MHYVSETAQVKLEKWTIVCPWIAAEERAKEKAKEAQEKTMWKKRNELQRGRRQYKTAEELLSEQERVDAEAAGVAGAAAGVSPATPKMVGPVRCRPPRHRHAFRTLLS